MEALIIILLITGCVMLGLGVAYAVLTWDTLKAHHDAMRAFRRELDIQQQARDLSVRRPVSESPQKPSPGHSR